MDSSETRLKGGVYVQLRHIVAGISVSKTTETETYLKQQICILGTWMQCLRTFTVV